MEFQILPTTTTALAVLHVSADWYIRNDSTQQQITSCEMLRVRHEKPHCSNNNNRVMYDVLKFTGVTY